MTNAPKEPTAPVATIAPLDTGDKGAGSPPSTYAETELDKLHFSIEKSKRYHQRRRGFFDACHNAVMFGVLVFGTSAVTNTFAALSGFGAAVLGALDLVFQFSHKARDHDNLFKRFSRLAIDIQALTTPTMEQVGDLRNRRLEIEIDEPPIFWALDADCDNEVCRAWDRDKKAGLVPLNLAQKILMNVYRFDRATFFKDRQSVD